MAWCRGETGCATPGRKSTSNCCERSDLIPDLVESVRGYMRHEAAIFENITAARRLAAAAGADVAARTAAEAALSQQMRGLLALAEAVPELRASDNMKSLQEELATTENRIAYARQFVTAQVGSVVKRPGCLRSGALVRSG